MKHASPTARPRWVPPRLGTANVSAAACPTAARQMRTAFPVATFLALPSSHPWSECLQHSDARHLINGDAAFVDRKDLVHTGQGGSGRRRIALLSARALPGDRRHQHQLVEPRPEGARRFPGRRVVVVAAQLARVGPLRTGQLRDLHRRGERADVRRPPMAAAAGAAHCVHCRRVRLLVQRVQSARKSTLRASNLPRKHYNIMIP